MGCTSLGTPIVICAHLAHGVLYSMRDPSHFVVGLDNGGICRCASLSSSVDLKGY